MRPSLSIPARSVLITSELIGPEITLAISLIRFSRETPSLAMSDGFVVTPSTIPQDEYFLISSMFAVSRKNCIKIFYISNANICFVFGFGKC